jgi:predicted GTPase
MAPIMKKVKIISKDSFPILQEEEWSAKEETRVNELIDTFVGLLNDYQPSLKSLERVLGYLIPDGDNIMVEMVKEMLMEHKELKEHWKQYIYNDEDSFKSAHILPIEKETFQNTENEYPSVKDTQVDLIKINRKMATCKSNCNLSDWLDFLESFDQDAGEMNLKNDEKLRVFFRQLGEGSNERVFFKHLKGENDSYDSIVKGLTQLKIGNDSEDYWHDEMDSFPEQKGTKPLTNCSGITTRTLGIPCSHTM